MTDEEKLKQQMTFFDYIYPCLTRRIDRLEQSLNGMNHRLFEYALERKHLLEHVNQYKKKIQRIEQFLIKHGLIKLLKKEQ